MDGDPAAAPPLTLIDEALEYLTWTEIQGTPVIALRGLIAARRRLRARERSENLHDDTMSKEVNQGQELKGQAPANKLPYKVLNTPYLRHQRALAREGHGLPPEETAAERAARQKAENRTLKSALLR